MATTVDFSAKPTETVVTETGRSDRALGGLLLAFFLALYLLTGGGHGYSPDGEFAWRMGRSLTLDPKHEYLSNMARGLDQWGFMMPVLSQPLILAGESLSHVLPQKDHAFVDGRDYLLAFFRGKDVARDAPTVGPKSPGVSDTFVQTSIDTGPGTSLSIISYLALARDVPQGAEVAELTVVDSDGNSVVFPFRAGVETAEWSLGKGPSSALHQMARIANIWGGNTGGRNYYVELPFGRLLEPKELRVRYLLPQGHLYLRSLAVLDSQSGTIQQIPTDSRDWSERENDELFTRFFFSFYNAFITALGCLLLFALARLLGYGQRVGLAATLVYGLATLAWPYSKYDFSEPTLALFVLATLHLILRWGQEHRDRYLLFAGITALACVGTKYASAVLVPLMLFQVLLLQWEQHPSWREVRGAARAGLLFCLPFLVVAVPALVILRLKFGYDPTFLEAWGGVQRGWLPLPFYLGFLGLLFSPGKSFFLFSPPTLLGVISAIPFVRRHGPRAFCFLAIALVYFSIYSKKAAWHAGAGWGPRYQVLVIPLMILIAAPLIQKAIEGRHRWARYALMTAFVLGLGVQLVGVPKSFDSYLGVFRSQVVDQLPDKGASYSMLPEYFEYAKGLDESNAITATMLAWPFSPILANGWLLSADLLNIGPTVLIPMKEKVLGNPPWKLWGIDVTPAHPEYGLGFDFWSMRMRTDFPSYFSFLAGVALVILLLEAILVASGVRVVASLFTGSKHRAGAVYGFAFASILALMVFDVIHVVL